MFACVFIHIFAGMYVYVAYEVLQSATVAASSAASSHSYIHI